MTSFTPSNRNSVSTYTNDKKYILRQQTKTTKQIIKKKKHDQAYSCFVPCLGNGKISNPDTSARRSRRRTISVEHRTGEKHRYKLVRGTYRHKCTSATKRRKKGGENDERKSVGAVRALRPRPERGKGGKGRSIGQLKGLHGLFGEQEINGAVLRASLFSLPLLNARGFTAPAA